MYPVQPKQTIGSRLLKQLTIGLFYILPSRVSKIFISLSMLSLIYHVRNTVVDKNLIDDSKLRDLLDFSFDYELMKLPEYTVHWFWSDSFLNEKINIRGDEISIAEAIVDSSILHSNYKRIIDALLSNVPKTLYRKLGLDSNQNRLVYKQSLLRLI